jgi:cold shock CspA family protein
MVKFYHSTRGCGFIVDEVSGAEFFVDRSTIADRINLAPEHVSFERGRKSNRIQLSCSPNPA